MYCYDRGGHTFKCKSRAAMLSQDSRQNMKYEYIRKIATDACLVGSMPTPNSPKFLPGLITTREAVPCTYTTSSGYNGTKSYPYSEYRLYEWPLELRRTRQRTVCTACGTSESLSLNQVRKLHRHSCEFSSLAPFVQRADQSQPKQAVEQPGSQPNNNCSNSSFKLCTPEDHLIKRNYKVHRQLHDSLHQPGVCNHQSDHCRRDRSCIVDDLASGRISRRDLPFFCTGHAHPPKFSGDLVPRSFAAINATLSERLSLSGIHEKNSQQSVPSNLLFPVKRSICHDVCLAHRPSHLDTFLPRDLCGLETYSDLLEEVHII